MEYVIRLVNEAKEESPVKAVTGQNESVGGESSGASSNAANYAVKLAKRAVSVAVIANTVDQVISHQRSLITIKTGAQEYGQRAAYGYQKTSSFIKSVAFGAFAGFQAGGPVGAAIGGGFAALMNVGGNVMEYFFQSDVVKQNQDLEDITRRMNMMRATVSGRRYSNVTEF